MPMPGPKKPTATDSPADQGRGAMQTRPNRRAGAPDSERNRQAADRQALRSPRAASRVRGGNLAVSKRREDPALNAILHTCRVASDPAPSYRMALGVSGAITSQVLDDLGLLAAKEGEGHAKAAGTLERHQVVLRRYEERSQAVDGAVTKVFDLARRARLTDLKGIQDFMTTSQEVVGAQGCATLGGALFEAGVLGHGLKVSREFSETPGEERLLKARFFALQHDGLRVTGLPENGMKEPAIYGFAWKENGQDFVAGLIVSRGVEKDTDPDGGNQEPLVVLDAVLDRAAEGGFEREVLDSKPLSAFLAERGIETDIFGNSVTSQDLRTFRTNGLTPIMAPVRTGDFLPENIQERLIPGWLVFDGSQSKASDLDRVLELGEDLRQNFEVALTKWSKEPANAARVQEAAQARGKSAHDIIMGEVEKQVLNAETALGISHAQALLALKEYLQERTSYPKTVRPDPFQIEVGREVTSLLAEFGLDPERDRRFYIDLDRVLDKAQEKFGSEPEVAAVRSPIQKHILVMRRAMEEMKNVIAVKLKLKPDSDEDKAKLDRIEEVLGISAQDAYNAAFLRTCKGVMEKGLVLQRALGQVMADSVLSAMLAEQQFTGPDGTLYTVADTEALMLRSRLSVRFGSKDDPYLRTPLTVARGRVTEWREALPKTAMAEAADAKIEAFLSLDANGEWTNRGMKAAVSTPDFIHQMPDGTADAPNMSKLRLLRAREGFKLVDAIQGAMEDHRVLPEYALRLAKNLGAIERDGQDDALKGTNPYAATGPSVEEGRAYIVPIKEGDKGVGYLMLRLERGIEGNYKVSERVELSDAQLRMELDRLNTLDYRVDVLRHAMNRNEPTATIMQHFGAYDMGDNRFLVSVQTEWNGVVAEALGIEMRGGFWPDASYDAHKNCFITRVPFKDGDGATRLDANGAEVPVVPGEDLSGPHTYLTVRDRGSRGRRNVFIPIPRNAGDIPAFTKAFGVWMDKRAESRGANRTSANMLPFFKSVAMDQYEALSAQSLDPAFAGFAALRPRQQGIFQPDLFSQTFLKNQGENLGREERVKSGSAAMVGLGNLIELRSRLGCEVEVQTVIS